jgi:hypothetical protein
MMSSIEYVNMVTENSFIENFSESIECQALYNSSIEEAQRTEGEGLCGILALAGIIVPHLNSWSVIQSSKGRRDIADVIDNIMLPSIQNYIQPVDHHTNQRVVDHLVHRDHTTE